MSPLATICLPETKPSNPSGFGPGATDPDIPALSHYLIQPQAIKLFFVKSGVDFFDMTSTIGHNNTGESSSTSKDEFMISPIYQWVGNVKTSSVIAPSSGGAGAVLSSTTARPRSGTADAYTPSGSTYSWPGGRSVSSTGTVKSSANTISGSGSTATKSIITRYWTEGVKTNTGNANTTRLTGLYSGNTSTCIPCQANR